MSTPAIEKILNGSSVNDVAAVAATTDYRLAMMSDSSENALIVNSGSDAEFVARTPLAKTAVRRRLRGVDGRSHQTTDGDDPCEASRVSTTLRQGAESRPQGQPRAGRCAS